MVFLSQSAVLVFSLAVFFFFFFWLPRTKEKSGKERERESGETLSNTIPFSSRRQPTTLFFFLPLPSLFLQTKMSNPVVFFDITADGAPLGRIEMTVSRLLLEREGERRSIFFLFL